jgi:hypothetical protein
MDPVVSTLIVSQTLTFILLIVSEILPLYDGPYNGVLQILLGVLQKVVVPPPQPVIVKVGPVADPPPIPLVTLPPHPPDHP